MMPATSRRTSSMRVGELSVTRFARTKDQTAHGTWPRKHSVHGLVAQKCRAGVLATAGACAWPTFHTRAGARESGLQADSKNIDDGPLNFPKHTSTDPKMPQDPRKGAIMAWAQICVIILAIYGAREGCGRIVIKQSNAAQKSNNQIPLVNATIPYHPEKESKQSKYR